MTILTFVALLSTLVLGTGGEQQTVKDVPPQAPPVEQKSETTWPAIIAAIGAIITLIAIELIKQKRADKRAE